jgi:hypothetical protein
MKYNKRHPWAKTRGPIYDLWILCSMPSMTVLCLVLSCIFFCLSSYAQEDMQKTSEIEDDTFRSRSIDAIDHSAFDVLNEQERYKNEPKNMFDVTEGNVPIEESDAGSPVVNNEIKPSLATIEETVGSYHKVARLIAINKITARSKQLSIKIGQSAYFGNIEILAEKCWNNGDVYSPSSKILVKVFESKIDEDLKCIFHGWLISSNIPVSGLQDASYELIAIDCHDNTIKTE